MLVGREMTMWLKSGFKEIKSLLYPQVNQAFDVTANWAGIIVVRQRQLDTSLCAQSKLPGRASESR